MAINPLAESDVIENAKSGRSTCRACHKKIDAGTPRYGMAFPSYDDEVGYSWFHLACGPAFAKNRFSVVYEKYKDQIPELAQLYKPGAAPRSTFPYIEAAPTGRSKCIECNMAIEKGEERLAIEREIEVNGFKRPGAGYLHLKCAPKHTKTADIVEQARANRPGAAPSAAAKPAAPAPKPRGDFELAIMEKPDAPDGYLVWGDALQAEGDPLGTLIGAASSTPAAFKAALKKNLKAVLGEKGVAALASDTLALEWRHGVVSVARVLADTNVLGVDDLQSLMTDLLGRKAFRFLRRFEVAADQDWWRENDSQRMSWVLEPLAKAAPPVLHAVVLGNEDNPCSMGGVHQVTTACRALQTLVVHGEVVSWKSLDAPLLTHLELHGDLTTEFLTALPTLPKLKSLTVVVDRSQAPVEAVIGALEACAALTHFTIRNYVQLDELTVKLAKTKALARLEQLTLDGRNLGSKGVDALTAEAKRLKAKVEFGAETKIPKTSLAAFKKALKG